MSTERLSSSLVRYASHPRDSKPPALFSSLRGGPDRVERFTGAVFAFGGLAIVLSLVGATWATMRYRDSTRLVQPDLAQVQIIRGGFAGQGGTISSPVLSPARARNPQVVGTGSLPPRPIQNRMVNPHLPVMDWNALALMVRTGFSDDEVIADAGGKQLAVSVGTEQERVLRGMGAGDRLIAFLRRQPIYNVPETTHERVVVSGSALPRLQTQPVYVAATPWPVVDHAARDRQIANLKQRIDALDEQMRVVRTSPKDSRHWLYYYSSHGIDQRRYDAYMKKLDEERDDLRRQKWQLEGR